MAGRSNHYDAGDFDADPLGASWSPSSPRTSELVGWLLRTNRLFAPSFDFSTAESFAAAFHGGSWRETVSVSRISRWETANTRPPHAAVRRYEEVLELPPNHLVAPIDMLYRYASAPRSGPPALRRIVRDDDDEQDRLDLLVERAQSSGTMTGGDWDEMTALLSTMPRVVLIPRTAWETMAGRLVTEMIVSSGQAWLQRFESLNRLLTHPRGQAAAISSCAALALDPSNQVFTEVVGALDGSSHPDAAAHVLAQLHNPTNERSRYGALLACVRKVRFHHFTDGQLAALVPIEFDLLHDPGARMDARDLAVELLQHSPAGMREQIRRRLHTALDGDPELTAVLTGGRLATPASARIVTRRVERAATAGAARDVAGYQDMLLPRLINDMLYHPVFDVRLYTAFLMNATPYRPAVAQALATEITGAAALRDPTLSRSVLSALRVIGGAEQRRTVERLIAATGIPDEVTAAAAQTIGHVGGVTSDATWGQMVRVLTRDYLSRPDPARAAALDAVVYGVGITHVGPLLHTIKADPDLPFRVRSAATWWLDVPAHIRDSALHQADA